MAAHWNGVDFEQFLEKDGIEQSRLVAIYETAMQMEAVTAFDVRRKAVRRQTKK